MTPFTERLLTANRSELAAAEFALKAREKEAAGLRETIAMLKTKIQRLEENET